MKQEWKDKKGNIILLGDKIISDDKIECKVLDEVYSEEFEGGWLLLARQIKDPTAVCIITQENLSQLFTKV